MLNKRSTIGVEACEMTRDWKYILYISLAVGAFVVLKMLSPKQYNWTITFSGDDKNPYGGYALAALLSAHVGPVKNSYKTLYELRDSIKTSSSLLIIAESFSAGDEDAITLLDHVYKGGSAFVSAKYFAGSLSDTLKVQTRSNIDIPQPDSISLRFVATRLDTSRQFPFDFEIAERYFYRFDTTRTVAVAVNEQKQPVTIRMKWGKGTLILNSTPLMFTNIGLLAAENHLFVSTHLSYLPKSEVVRTQYYQLGRREITTPLRFILLNEPLAWAYYITIFCLLAFMLFEMKRRQRIIPVITPLANTTLEFVATIGDLYYQRGDHRNISDKKISFFLEYVRTKYSLRTRQLDSAFAAALAKKADKEESEVVALVSIINGIRSATVTTPDQLIDLNAKLESFYHYPINNQNSGRKYFP